MKKISLYYRHRATKNTARKNRNNKKKYKQKERVKNAPYQKICDKYKRTLKKKGKGRALKIKGQILPTPLDTNNKTTKSWTRVGYGSEKPLKEGIKLYAIYAIT